MSEVAVKPDLDGLRMVVEAVRQAEPRKFNMTKWSCGTKACAVGWFCHFNPDDRLRLRIQFGEPGPYLVDQPDLSVAKSLMARFGISHDDVFALFSIDEYAHYKGAKGRTEVAARIEQFIREHEAT